MCVKTHIFLLSAFDSLVGSPLGTSSSEAGLKIGGITAGIKKSISQLSIQRVNDQIVLITKSKLNTIEDFISKALINSCINHNKFVSVNKFLKGIDKCFKHFLSNRHFVKENVSTVKKSVCS